MASAQLRPEQVKWIKAAAFVLCLAPLALLTWRGFNDGLGANPIEYITHSTGWWTLTFLLITLTVTPLRRLTNWNWLLRLRRMLGLFAFFYACLHFTTYIWLDQFFDVRSIVHDIGKRPFITAGFTALTLMLPLALTSTSGMIRRLGGRRWQRLHRLIYFSAAAGVVHYWWLVKADLLRPQIYASILGALVGIRLVFAVMRARRRAPAPPRRVTRPLPPSLETTADAP